jgi:hypothetical protein
MKTLVLGSTLIKAMVVSLISGDSVCATQSKGAPYPM